MKYLIKLLLASVFLICTVSSFFADDTEFFRYYVTPNVWIILDTSGSMTWDMQGDWTGGDGSEGYEGWDTDGDGLPNDARMYMVKNALHMLVSDPEIEIRWGLASFYQDDYWGSSDGKYTENIWWHSATQPLAYQAFFQRVQMAEGAPAHINAILKWVDNGGTPPKQEFRAQGGTPIPGALRGARYEYQSTIPQDNARWCRGYYVLFLTDGEPTYGINPDGTWAGNGSFVDPLWQSQCASEAESLMNTYIPPQGGDPEQVVPIKTFVVGVGLEGSTTLENMAIAGGTNHYYPATSPEELQAILQTIVSDIISEATSYSGAEVTSIQEEFITQGYEAKLYLCSFVPSYAPIWEGHMKCIKLVPGRWDIDSIPDSLVYWDAGEILKTTPIGSRNIYTEKNGTLIAFSSSNITAADLDVANDSIRDAVINTVYSGSPTGTMGHFGDIFHSTPLRIFGPNYFYTDDEFYMYRAYQDTTRQAAIYAGANDGMLHCTNDSTGAEMWAYIPNDQLPNLKYLLTEHKYYEDANVMAADVWFPSSPTDTFKDWTEWKTVLFFGQRQGGRHYSALDVTDPFNMGFFYNFDTMFLGETWSDPVVFKIHKNTYEKTGDRFFAFLGGGYWPDSLYDIYDPPLSPVQPPYGNVIIAKDVYNCCTNNPPVYGTDYWTIPAGPAYSADMKYPFAAQASVVDTNLDSYFDNLYIGDIAGQLWKVILNGPDSASIQINNWEAEIIFKAPKPLSQVHEELWQPIFFPVTYSMDMYHRWWLFFGTGDRAIASKEDTENRFYAILDSNYTDPLTESDLKRVSSLGPLTEAEIQAGTYRGWYFVFEDFDHTDSIGVRDGEKVTSFATVLLDTLIFTTFQPCDNSDPCMEASGVARLYKTYYKSGGYGSTSPSTIIGVGIPQSPRFSFDISGEGIQIINLPGEVIVTQTPNLGIRRKLLWWDETK